MAFSEDFIDRVRDSNDIVEVIREYFPLKKSGQNYRALCPFHNEKTPSFFISPSKQIYHCFGCGEGGNVFNFVMKIENISFYEAVKKLAERAGITVPRTKEEPEEVKRKKLVLDIIKKTSLFYSRYFWESKSAFSARDYILKKRDVKEEVAREFLIGYSPKGNILVKEANKKGIDITLLEEAGLVLWNNNRKNYVDRFIDRIIFPIENIQGKVIGFGGRVLDEKKTPKYLNSPETRFFHKQNILYNFNRAKDYALKENSLIITEGYMDVIALWQRGFKNVVATMGTAFTESHVRTISRFVENVYLLFDPDFAGKTAVIRSLSILLKSGLNVYVVLNNTDKDPDELLKEKGSSFLRNMLKNGVDLITFMIEEACKGKNIKNIEDKVRIARDVIPVIKSISNLIRQKEEIKKLSEKIKVEEEILWAEMKKVRIEEKVGQLEKKIKERIALKGKIKLEEEIIAYLMNNPGEIEYFTNIVRPEEFEGEYNSLILENIYKLKLKDTDITESKLINLLKDEKAQKKLSYILWEVSKRSVSKEDIISSWKREKLKKEYEELKKEIENKIKNSEEIPRNLYKRFQEVVKNLKHT